MDKPPPVTTAPPLTPCIGVCRLGDDGRCVGCARTLAEIAAWGSLDDAARRRLMTELAARRGSHR